MLASYVITFEKEFRVKDGKVSVESFKYATDVLTAENPKYEGFNDDGGRYFVTAKIAELDVRQKKPIKLDTITGRMTETSGATTNLNADHGFYNEKTKVLDLRKKVVVITSSGMRADLTEARVETDQGRISSNSPALVTVPSGKVRGNRLTVDQKARLITFYDGVKTYLKPASETPKKPPESQASTATGQQTFGDPAKPTLIDSEKLVIDDTAKIATFSGKVRAVQADSSLEAPELVVQYENADKTSTGQSSKPPASADPSQSGKIKSIYARGNVVLVQAENTATSKTAEFHPLARKARLSENVVVVSKDNSRVSGDDADIDTAADTILLTGNVVVVQEKNELRGRRLFIDRKAGTTLLTSPADKNQPISTISARLYQQTSADKPQNTNKSTKNAKNTKRAEGTKSRTSDQSLVGTTAFQTDPNAPIDVVSQTFSSSDATSKAIFLGDVRAQQGEVNLKAAKLIATYEGGSIAGASTSPTTGINANAARITSIRAEKDVEITSQSGQKATGDWADFDTARNIVTLGGKVALVRGKQIIRGPKLVIDLTSGISRMETGSRGPGPFLDDSREFVAGPGQLPNPAKRPVMPVLKTTPTAQTECPPGRMCMLLYRDETGAPVAKRKQVQEPTPRSSGWSTSKPPQQ